MLMVLVGALAALATLGVLIYLATRIAGFGLELSYRLERFSGWAIWVAWGFAVAVPAYIFAFGCAGAVFFFVSGVTQ